MSQIKIKIVSGSGGQPQRVAYNQIKLDFKSHCILCLQPQPSGPGTFLNDVTGKNPKNIEDFQILIHYLTGTDPTPDKSPDECLRMGIPFMGKLLPPMCPSCYDIMAELYRLHRELLTTQAMIQRQTALAREVVRGTLHGKASTASSGPCQYAPAPLLSSPRQLFYSRILNSSSEDGEVTVIQQQVTSEAFTIKFVEGLHDRVIVEANAKRRLKFPPYLPLNFKLPQVRKGAQAKRKSRGDPGSKVLGPSLKTTSTPTSSPASVLKGRPDGGLELIWRPSPPAGGQPEVISLDSDEEDAASGEPNLEDMDVASRSPTVIDLDSEDEEDQFPSSSNKPQTAAGGYLPIPGAGGPMHNQRCDLCDKWIHYSEIIPHLESHHVKDYILKCPNQACHRVYSCRGKLAKHFQKQPKTCKKVAQQAIGYPLIKCEACKEKFQTGQFRSHLQDHERVMKDKTETISCPIPECGQNYALKQSVGEHLMTHDLREKTEQTCSSCKETINITDMPKHLKQVHEATDIVRCKRCPFLFPNWESLLDHLLAHSSGVELSCDLCDAPEVTFAKYSSLRQHYFNVHQIGNKFCCEQCDLEYFSPKSFATHVSSAHSAPNNEESTVIKVNVPRKKTVKCELCPEASFHSRIGLLDHQLKIHDSPPVTCKFCPETFATVLRLQRHELGHQVIGRTYKCKVDNCGRVFHTFTVWRQHQRGAHSSDPGSRTFVCDTCGRGFYMKHILRSHINRVHLKLRGPRRVCGICGESLSSGKALQIHKRIHTGDRPFECKICGQAFRHKEVLKTHVEGHEKKGDSFKPNGPMKNIRKRVAPKEPGT